jgi:hypothetical protein
MFSRKHYVAIAKAISVTPDSKRNGVVGALVALFTADNPAFDAGRFVAACDFVGVGASDRLNVDGATPGASSVLAEEG